MLFLLVDLFPRSEIFKLHVDEERKHLSLKVGPRYWVLSSGRAPQRRNGWWRCEPQSVAMAFVLVYI